MRFSTKIRKHTYSHRVVDCRNNLSTEIHDAPCTNTFKNLLDNSDMYAKIKYDFDY